MGEPQTSHFYDSRAPSSQNQLFYLWRHQDTFKKVKNNTWDIPKKVCFVNLKISENHSLSIFEKAGTDKWWRSV